MATSFRIEPIPLLQDNYAYAVIHEPTQSTVVIDPAEAKPVLAWLKQHSLNLVEIWNTHHHWDHTNGNLELKKMTGASVVGNGADRNRIPGLDVEVGEATGHFFRGLEVKILETSGHTRGAICFYLPEWHAVFTGDTLFSLGCGRLFEGTASEMWASLSKIAKLPEATEIFCGHEYTLENLEFAIRVDPQNPALLEKRESIRDLRAQGKPSVPSRLGEEKRLNPFLRPDDFRIKQELRLETSGPVKVFGELRRRKDVFRSTE